MKDDTLRSDRVPLAWTQSDRPNVTGSRRGGKRMRRLLACLAATIAAGVLIAVHVTGGAAAPSARAASLTNGLFAYVVPTNPGPLPPCTGNGDCTATNTVWHFIHVVNANQLTNMERGTNRATVPNSFVVSSVDWKIFVNGTEVPAFDTTFTPPPDANLRSWSGHWPSTVTCPSDGTACNVVGSPAVLPGENTVAVYAGWIHGSTEANGTYVFKYTIHGTLNGNPVDLTASSPPIQMTG
jgi:hypothetical protein